MTEKYTPRIGDKVRRVWGGEENHVTTTIEGVIQAISAYKFAYTGGYGNVILFDPHHPEQTELLERPTEFKTWVGMAYRDPADYSNIMVKVDSDSGGWLGHVMGDKYENTHWFRDETVRDLVENHGWKGYDIHD